MSNRPDPNAKAPGAELEIALNHLQARVEAEELPSRHDARWLLMELGETLQSRSGEDCKALIARARKVAHRLKEGWGRAVAEELQLAVSEHVHAVDPRWLSHPRYDMAYTLSARARLEARIIAAEALGTPLDDTMAQAVAHADKALAAHRAKTKRDG